MTSRLLLLFVLLSRAVSSNGRSRCPLKPPSAIRTAPIVIAHRGASFHLPEHTLAGYRLALELGADYIEPDLVGTKDGHLVVVHSIDLSITTNVAEVFPNRSSTLANGDSGYYAFDFTLKEIHKLKVNQRLPTARSTEFDGKFHIPTLQETLELLHDWNENILPLLSDEPHLLRAGLYAELKDPDLYMEKTNTSMVDLFLQELHDSPHTSYLDEDVICDSLKYNEYVVPPLVVQCFDASALKEMHAKWNYNTTLNQVLLLHESDCFREDVWFRDIGESRDFIKGVGVDKKCLFGKKAREFMTKAEEYSLAVHPWVERRELDEVGGDSLNLQQELRYLYCNLGVQGVFSENVADAVLVGQVGCDKNTTEESESEPTSPLINLDNSTDNTTNGGGLCYTSGDEQAMYVGVAAGIMGLFVGCVATLCIANSRYCRKRRAHQLVVPHHDDMEMI